MRSLRTILASVALLLTGTAAHAADEATYTTVVEDPHYGEVLFHFYQQDYFPAIVRLLAARERERLPNHDEESELLLGGLLLSYGQHERAAGIFERLLAGNTSPSVRDRTWFFLARIWQQRGYYDEARAALGNIEGELPGSMQSERQLLLAQILIAQGELEAAIASLSAFRDRSEWTHYARFNLGVALARAGNTDEAANLLDDLGRDNAWTPELVALRDKANLALGYAYLQAGDSRAAVAPLQRVRLNGPFSAKALLGVGWADAERERFEHALVPWMELRGRSLLDPAVQEAMLAVPYAMAKLDSISQAADYYLDAVEAFYEEHSRIDRTINALESGELLQKLLADNAHSTTGWHWRLENLPEGVESRYLYHLLATHDFQEALKNYRDLDYLARNLERWLASVDVFRDMLATRRAAYDERLPRIIANLEASDLEAMIDRKLAFDAQLDSIEAERDIVALATDNEAALWAEIRAIEQSPALAADLPEAEDARHKVRLMKGVLTWELDKAFRERLWRLRRDVRQSGEALVETQRSRRRVDQSMRTEPLQFAALAARVDTLEPQIRALRARVGAALDRQRAYLQGIAGDEMRAQKARLETYSVQARFALAAIYDLSAAGSEVSP